MVLASCLLLHCPSKSQNQKAQQLFDLTWHSRSFFQRFRQQLCVVCVDGLPELFGTNGMMMANECWLRMTVMIWCLGMTNALENIKKEARPWQRPSKNQATQRNSVSTCLYRSVYVNSALCKIIAGSIWNNINDINVHKCAQSGMKAMNPSRLARNHWFLQPGCYRWFALDFVGLVALQDVDCGMRTFQEEVNHDNHVF